MSTDGSPTQPIPSTVSILHEPQAALLKPTMRTVASDGDEASVETTLHALADHFSQPIHANPDAGGHKDAPYFDALLGGPTPSFAPVTQHLWDELQHRDSQTTILVWLGGYGRQIRPCLIQNENVPDWSRLGSAIVVLQQYELILTRLRGREKEGQTARRSTETNSELVLSETMQLLAGDISVWTTRPPETGDVVASTKLISNQLLPILLRLLNHALHLSDYFFPRTQSSVLRRCTISLLAFGVPRIGPASLAPAVRESLNHVVYTFNVVQDTNGAEDEKIPIGDTWVDLTKLELNGAAWDDPLTGIASRAAQSCWEALLESELADPDRDSENRSVRQNVVRSLGMQELALFIRANFFGRRGQEVAASRQPPPKYPLPLPTLEPEKAYKQSPSRIHAALHFISLLQCPSSSVLAEVLPICYELLEKVAYEAVAASAIVHLLEAQPDRQQWENFQDTLLSVLEMAIIRKGPGVIFAAMAQSHAFAICTEGRPQRRKATHELLILIRRMSSNESDPDGTVTGLLLYGVIPLLRQHSDEPNADALELGRLGLDALLPLLRWDGVPRVQLTGLVALRCLLIGAYPVMPRHAGKVICELLACLGHTSRCIADEDASEPEVELRESILEVGQHVASLAVMICGKKASAILDQVEHGGNYDKTLVKHVGAVRKLAEGLTNVTDKDTDRGKE